MGLALRKHEELVTMSGLPVAVGDTTTIRNTAVANGLESLDAVDDDIMSTHHQISRCLE
jgi:hypothetical protein